MKRQLLSNIKKPHELWVIQTVVVLLIKQKKHVRKMMISQQEAFCNYIVYVYKKILISIHIPNFKATCKIIPSTLTLFSIWFWM